MPLKYQAVTSHWGWDDMTTIYSQTTRDFNFQMEKAVDKPGITKHGDITLSDQVQKITDNFR